MDDLEEEFECEKKNFIAKHNHLRKMLCGQLMAQQGAIIEACFAPQTNPVKPVKGVKFQDPDEAAPQELSASQRALGSKKLRKAKQPNEAPLRSLVMPLDSLERLVMGIGDLHLVRGEMACMEPEMRKQKELECEIKRELDAITSSVEAKTQQCRRMRGEGLEACSNIDLNQMETAHQTGAHAIQSALENLRKKEMVQLQNETETIQDRSKCCICLTNNIGCLLMPCAHFCVCSECGEGLTDCPICRQVVTQSLAIAIERPAGEPLSMSE